jgi:chemotaxis protein MotB
MRNIAMIVLSAVLAIALIFGLLFYYQYRDTKGALLKSEKEVAYLNDRVAHLEQEIFALHDQIRKNAETLKEFEGTQSRISGLEHAITIKDRALSECKDKSRTAQKELEREREINAHLKTELASKDASLMELWESLKDDQSRIRYLEEEIARRHDEIEDLGEKLSALKEKKTLAETKIDQLKSTYEGLIKDFEQQIENQEVTISTYEEKISVTFVDRILFDFGRATITPEGEKILAKAGKTIKTVKDRNIRVVGHTDNISIMEQYQYKFPSNWELSSSRAAAVVRYFQKEGSLDPRNLEVVGRSFYDPIASNTTAEGRAQNRRVEIIIAPKLE